MDIKAAATNYRYLLSEIVMLEQEIKEIEDNAIQGLDYSELLSILNKRKKRCEKESSCFEERIIAVPDKILQKAIFLRYVDGLRWARVAMELHTNEDQIKKAVARYIKKCG